LILFLTGIGFCSRSLAQKVPQPGPAVPTRSTDRHDLLREFQTYLIRSDTPFLSPDLLRKACEDRADFAAWQLSSVTDEHEAEIVIVVDHFIWNWHITILERASYRVLASNNVTTLSSQQAVPLLAAAIASQIQSVRGIPPAIGKPIIQSEYEQANLRRWRVKGGPGPFQDKDLTLTIGAAFILVSDGSGRDFNIPMQRLLSAYDFVPQVQKQGELVDRWDRRWDDVCRTMDASGECYPLVFVAPVWLAGEAALSAPILPGTHFVTIRWQEGQGEAELSFQPRASEWEDMLRQLQASLGKAAAQTAGEVQGIRQKFGDGKQTNLTIYLETTIQIGGWPPLRGPNRYRIIVIERTQSLAEIFFYDLGDPRLTTPLAVATAHFERVPHIVATITFRLRDNSVYKSLDEIRYEDVVLQFDPGN